MKLGTTQDLNLNRFEELMSEKKSSLLKIY